MSKSILVTGATGFIGSHLVEELLKKQHHVESLIRKGKTGNPKSKTITGDITDKNMKLGDAKYDCVFHLASHTPLEKNKKTLQNVNLEGTKNLFNAINNNTKSFLYVSGMGVYGETGDKIVDETFPYSPNTEFVKTRLKAQEFLEKNCKELGIDFSVVHFGDVYGTKGWFYEFLIKRLLKNTFRLPKGGKYYKCFVHIDDAVGSLISILENNRFNERFNVVDSTHTKFNDFVNYTADSIGIKHPGNVPTFLVKALLGSDLTKLLTTSIKASNKKISEIYQFKFPSYETGVTDIISELKKKGMLATSKR
ncbi:NAD(P)-dependent oxidoreductase [Nitrosopumilus sp. K4]|uniref:NAD-dependent epimerase/dehydratase family protein n=1 Tax=Nitrosopumilus sp. K4 TaxID=2795383 RepID=UPI001BA65161|nr:NAD(P)-dependent oxidoreductase [Nitrosopumilus sp. K4]QUC65214.1 NAD(P)-dependent oxidoreductase [Nitrosopumilus sp. K4]